MKTDDPTTSSIENAASSDQTLYEGIFGGGQPKPQTAEPRLRRKGSILLEGPGLRVVHLEPLPETSPAAHGFRYPAQIVVEVAVEDALGRVAWREHETWEHGSTLYKAFLFLDARRTYDRQHMQDLVRVAADRARVVLGSTQKIVEELAQHLDRAYGEPGTPPAESESRAVLESVLDDVSGAGGDYEGNVDALKAIAGRVRHFLLTAAPPPGEHVRTHNALRSSVDELRAASDQLRRLIDGAHMMILGDRPVDAGSPEAAARAVVTGELDVQTTFAWVRKGGGK